MAVEKMAYSIRETAEAIGLHPNTVYELVQQGNYHREIRSEDTHIELELSKWLAGQSNTPPAGTGAAN